MKRLLRSPIRIFFFAIQYRMYGIIAAYVLFLAFIGTWIGSGFRSAVVSVGAIVACILIFRGAKNWLERLTPGSEDLARRIRREEKRRQLMEYLIKD